jgi:hypothetical protein
MGGYTRPVSRQRLCKHVPAATVRHATEETESVLRCYKQETKSVESQFCTGLEHGSRGIAIVRSSYQETFSEDTAGWKRLSVCCNDL